jgi:hypothetical protein
MAQDREEELEECSVTTKTRARHNRPHVVHYRNAAVTISFVR